ncbi:MAG: hypothetical protein PHW13_12405 [Methylococcales bacterium]|nr:hypothetical protein [Methylococcales bacterium]
MTDLTLKPATIPKSGLFRWEIGIALLFKIVLLTGLWFLIFRWSDKPAEKPDIAAHLLSPGGQAMISPDLFAQPQQETRHVR